MIFFGCKISTDVLASHLGILRKHRFFLHAQIVQCVSKLDHHRGKQPLVARNNVGERLGRLVGHEDGRCLQTKSVEVRARGLAGYVQSGTDQPERALFHYSRSHEQSHR